MKKIILYLFCIIFCLNATAQLPLRNDTIPWWKANNLRLIQVNLPAYEATTLDPDSLVKDLLDHSANTLIINAGGIMAFYPTKLPFHYINPWMKKNMLGDVVSKCHANNIRVIVRFDFSRAHKTIFKQHPDWFYISPKGERIINTDMYVVSINAPYVQEKAFDIIGEVIDLYPVDGVFLNMPGYQTRNAYEGKYHGIDQNEYDKKAFDDYCGLHLPVEEKKTDKAFQQYKEFKKVTIEEWAKRLHELIKSKNENIALCTYFDKYVDIIRHESQTNSLPYWPYSASDNVGNAGNSYPNHIISNSSIQQISFQSRFNAVEPVEVSIRLYENIANGSGLDVSMMGDMRGYEDERNFGVIKKIYAFHKKFEPYFGKYKSPAQIVVISPGPWPMGDAMQEYRGILLMLKEAHIPFDIIEDAQVANRAERIKQYKLIILPDITYAATEVINTLKEASRGGSQLIATNKTFFDNAAALQELFGARIVDSDYEGSGNYISIGNTSFFKRLRLQKMLFWKFNLGQYDLTSADSVYLPILSKGRPGPPEIIGGHEPTGYYAMGMKSYGKSKNVILPENIGKLYYLHGYEEHKNILLDVIDHIFPQAGDLIQTDAPPRVETILQQYTKNIPGNSNKTNMDGLILHLINLTGFSGNTYFAPLPVSNISFRIRSGFKPSKIFTLTGRRPVPFTWKERVLAFKIEKLTEFESVVIDKK
ncbi:MAG: alpha-amylase family protein [Chitinophagaceae bacterium]